MAETPVHNPFVGPRPLETNEALYGRGPGLEALLNEIKSRRVVVLHGPSGAGKSSLIRAGLIPRMKRSGFDVWPTIHISPELTRVGDVPAGSNPYILSAMLSLESEIPNTRQRSASELAELAFAEYVQTRPRRKKHAKLDVALIFDSLDDVLNAGPHVNKTLREFFAAVGEALHNQRCWAVFVVRDELLAKLTLHSDRVPTGLSNTFHLDLLNLDAAREVVVELARRGGRSFTAVDELLGELSTVELEGSDGELAFDRSEWVHPMRLQVVCRRLWDAAPAGSAYVDCSGQGPINQLDELLAADYAEAVAELAHGAEGVERELRDWIGRTLMVHGRCVPVRDDALRNAPMGELLLELLLARGLLRSKEDGGHRWLELGHERLVKAIRLDNAAWNRAYPRLLAKLEALAPSLSSRAARADAGSSEDSWSRPPRSGDAGDPAAESTDSSSAGVEASESSWLYLPSRPLARAEQRPVAKLSLVTRARLTDVGRRLLRASEAGGELALVGVALPILALVHEQVDRKRAVPWATASAVMDSAMPDTEALLEHLQAGLATLGDPEGYADLPAHDHPTVADLVGALVELGAALRRSRGPRKREILVAAFQAGFQAEFFTTGMTPHLWAIARAIEHPELELLEVMLRERGVGTPIRLHAHEHGTFFVGKLCELGLASYESRSTGRVVVLSEMATRFHDYLVRGRPGGAETCAEDSVDQPSSDDTVSRS